MKRHEPPIPVRSVVCLPRWLMIVGVAISAGCIAAGVGLAVYAFGWAEGGARAGLLGGAVGCVFGGGGGLFGTLNDWHRRLPATVLLQHLRDDRPSQFYRRVFWPALVVLVLGVVAGCCWSHRAIWNGVVQPSGMLTFLAGVFEVVRRHTTRQARAVFALYADGALDPADAAAIDAARTQDPRFDAAVREWLDVSARLGAFARGEART